MNATNLFAKLFHDEEENETPAVLPLDKIVHTTGDGTVNNITDFTEYDFSEEAFDEYYSEDDFNGYEEFMLGEVLPDIDDYEEYGSPVG